MIRKIFGVIAGYLIFAVSAVVLFHSAGLDPHKPQSTGFELLTGVYGLFFSVLAGIVLQSIAHTRSLTVNYVLAGMMAGFAALSMLMSGGSHWTQWMAILIFAPASLVGGWFYLRRREF
ncbi:hypothetical protein HQ865_07295 [Mucilaginibacter mali]|uniref:Uncharacterized protein n=1 Tax=Mucilaginibacter mali TaxID=2740462 RepID=A0A7D4Q9R3_9SPHI|nr:hypothetical protein [Mucilaginibacter mali]QKJ29564.1 hypothetical protein HQ865_07295 [Mucilaginibacter mali]